MSSTLSGTLIHLLVLSSHCVGQVKLTKDLDGVTCTLPAATRNMYVDGEVVDH